MDHDKYRALEFEGVEYRRVWDSVDIEINDLPPPPRPTVAHKLGRLMLRGWEGYKDVMKYVFYLREEDKQTQQTRKPGR